MPLLTSSDSTQLSMSTVRQFLAASGNASPIASATVDLSLSGMELAYMGSNTVGTGLIVSTAKVCMWRQNEIAIPPLAPYTNNPGFGPGVGAWNYANGTGVPWRPSRFSEFQRAYYAPPSAVGYGVPTGAPSSTGIIRFSFAGGSPAAFGSGLYFLYLDSGNIGSGWYSTSTNTRDFASPSSGNATAWVVDDRYCGGQMTGGEIRVSGSITYP